MVCQTKPRDAMAVENEVRGDGLIPSVATKMRAVASMSGYLILMKTQVEQSRQTSALHHV